MTLSILTRRALLGLAATMPMSAPLPASAQDRRSARIRVLFDTAGHPAAGDVWNVPVEVWVYRPQNSRVRKGLIARLFQVEYGLAVTDANRAVFDRRINLLLADNVGGVSSTVRFGSLTTTFPPTSANGHSTSTVRLPITPMAPLTGARIPIELDGSTAGRAHLVPAEGVTVISDIDDTVKDTGVLDKRRLWESTFYQPFKAVPGMANLVRRLAGPDGAVHYVSSTPWHLYAPLREWLAADGFPVSSLHLKQIRLKDRTVLDILESPDVMKPPVIAGLLQRWPKRRFVLLGDSGEKDPEIYAGIAKRFPQQVERILIRRAPGDASATRRFTDLFADIDRTKWQLFENPADVTT